MRKLLAGVLLIIAGFIPRAASSQAEPIVRIGLNQNVASVTLRSASSFKIFHPNSRSAKFSVVLSADLSVLNQVVKKEDLRYRMVVELDNGTVLGLPLTEKVRIESAMPIEFEGKTYRGNFEVFGNSRNTFTVVDELPLEQYLQGVVPNE